MSGESAEQLQSTASAPPPLYTDPDARSQHALSSPYAVNLGDPSAYLDGDRIIQIAKEQGCQGIHPGYGFVQPPLVQCCRMKANLTAAERESYFRKEVHRGWSDVHWATMAGH
jgi:3-methylcrotonyl-CoA carboxylase alpha subunit